MQTETQIRQTLEKVRRLHAGAKTDGERQAAAAAIARLKVRLGITDEPSQTGASSGDTSSPTAAVEIRLKVRDDWSGRLLEALCERDGIGLYRRPRQHRSTVQVCVSPEYFERAVMRPYRQNRAALIKQFNRRTEEMIRMLDE